MNKWKLAKHVAALARLLAASFVGLWWAKPQVHGFTEVVKIEYRFNRELWT